MPHVSEQHAQHDPLVVVSLAAGDLTGADSDLAAALIADCTECASLHDDLLAIARATVALPPAARPRDFQLSPKQAARLQPAGWRRFVGAFASPRLAMTRQLGIGLTTIGLAGLLVSVLPSVQLVGMGGSAAAPAPAASRDVRSADESARLGAVPQAASAAASAPAASAAPAATSAAASDGSAFGAEDSASPNAVALLPSSSGAGRSAAADGLGGAGSESGATVQPLAPGDVQAETADQAEKLAAEQENEGDSTLLVASAMLLIAGLALLIARRIARGVTAG
jgi:hypothetical protein